MRHCLNAPLSLLLLLFCASLQAAPLSDADIRQWANTYQAVMAWANKTSIQQDFAAGQKSIQQNDIFGQMMMQAKAQGYYQELAGVVKSNGYSDPQQWAVVGDRIFKAFLANHTEGDMEPQIRQLEAMLDSNAIPPEQKAAMEAILQQSLATLKSIADTPAEDKAAVQRNEAVLQSLFGM
ncbi:hypothetical protein [Pseudomaricurvus sp. HS19]|uniref:hypothetical protein n=1 Tax=Pseudomaricurvus sp. HS19 TaxID=2692626 RepID=UPI00137029CF|nr:hypothetical protein [Pseudomaricurvus sp. HS19]MYM64478.1 hypothetical protein [Pseudomaricurvus sp. HS19]